MQKRPTWHEEVSIGRVIIIRWVVWSGFYRLQWQLTSFTQLWFITALRVTRSNWHRKLGNA